MRLKVRFSVPLFFCERIMRATLPPPPPHHLHVVLVVRFRDSIFKDFEVHARLSNSFPNVVVHQQLEKESRASFQGISAPVNVTRVSGELDGFRLIANGFHHRVFLAAPFLKPFRLSRLVLTSLPPRIPLFLLRDRIVSCLRATQVWQAKRKATIAASTCQALAFLFGNDNGFSEGGSMGQCEMKSFNTKRLSVLAGFPM